MKTLGIILIVAGILALMYTGFTFKTEEKIVDLGPIQVEKEKKHSFNWPPIAGCILLLSGGTLMLADKRSNVFK